VATFDIKLNALPRGSQQFSYSLDGSIFADAEPIVVLDAAVECSVAVERKSDTLYHLVMECRGSIVVPCDRCLDPLTLPVDTAYELSLKHEGDEWDDSVDGVLVIPARTSELDLKPLLRDTVLLTIPMAHYHAPGECNEAMLHYVSSDDDSREETAATSNDDDNDIDPRWEALRRLKDNENRQNEQE